MPEKTLSPEKQLASFLAKFTPEESSLAEEILAKMRKRYPTALELVYDNYNALAIGFGPSERASEAIFSIALFPKWISLFFLKGVGLDVLWLETLFLAGYAGVIFVLATRRLKQKIT